MAYDHFPQSNAFRSERKKREAEEKEMRSSLEETIQTQKSAIDTLNLDLAQVETIDTLNLDLAQEETINTLNLDLASVDTIDTLNLDLVHVETIILSA